MVNWMIHCRSESKWKGEIQEIKIDAASFSIQRSWAFFVLICNRDKYISNTLYCEWVNVLNEKLFWNWSVAELQLNGRSFIVMVKSAVNGESEFSCSSFIKQKALEWSLTTHRVDEQQHPRQLQVLFYGSQIVKYNENAPLFNLRNGNFEFFTTTYCVS